MAAVPSSSKPSPSRSVHRPRRDVFKPKFPLDPFAGASAAALGEPWFLKIDALLSATAQQRRNVIFVLGAPNLTDLAPILQSRHLAKSLVILATHAPPDIPGIVIPTVRVLRLSAPLALEDAGAVRFVNVLEWAERVARTWRKHGGGGVLELSEDTDLHGDLLPPSTSRFGSQSMPTSPGSSSTHLSSAHLSSEATPSRPSSRPSSMIGSLLSRRGSGTLPPPDPSQRPFDVLINFMPAKVPDKALLKNSILVTTISRPFLTSTVHPTPLPPSPPAHPTMRSRTTSSSSSSNHLRPRARPLSIFGAFSRSASSVYMPPTPPSQSGESLSLALAQLAPAPPGKALLVHLLPAPHPSAPPGARRKLVESMESFLLSFAFQAPAGLSPAPSPVHLSMSGPAGTPSPLERARPYVMQASTFCDAVRAEPGVGGADYTDMGGDNDGDGEWDWTVADVVLSGALDADTPAGSSTAAAPSIMTTSASVGAVPRRLRAGRRAWIAGAADVVVMPGSTGMALNDDPGAGAGAEAVVGYPNGQAPGQLQVPGQFSGQSQGQGRKDRTRSSSAPLLTTSAPAWTPNQSQSARPVSMPQPPAAVTKNGRGSYVTGPAVLPGGLPTPPHSEESEEGEDEHYRLDAPDHLHDRLDASNQDHDQEHDRGASKVSVAVTDLSVAGSGKGPGGKSEKSGRRERWKFWRRLGVGHAHAHTQPAALKV